MKPRTPKDGLKNMPEAFHIVWSRPSCQRRRWRRPDYDLATAAPGSFAIAPIDGMIEALTRDYDNTKAMIFGRAPDFAEVLLSIGEIERISNKSWNAWLKACLTPHPRQAVRSELSLNGKRFTGSLLRDERSAWPAFLGIKSLLERPDVRRGVFVGANGICLPR